MAGPTRTVPIPVFHEFPFVWAEARSGRERLGAATRRVEAMLRVVHPTDLKLVPQKPDDGWYGDGEALEPEVGFESERWVRMVSDDTDSATFGYRLKLAVEGTSCRQLAMPFERDLAGQSGLASEFGADGRALRDAIASYETEAASWARGFVQDYLIDDGAGLWMRRDWMYGAFGELWGRPLSLAHTALKVAARLRGAHPEVDRLSAPVRRMHAREVVAALPDAEIPDFTVAIHALSVAVSDAAPRRGQDRTFLERLTKKTAELMDSARASIPEEDVEALSWAGPGR